MIGYSCKYAPLELIAAYGGKSLMLDAETKDFSRAETLTHANVCCHAKALLTQALDISELVLTDCCDATRRTYDVLESEGRQRFLFQFDLPHDDAACARQRMTHELLRFAKAYGAYTGAAFSKAKFLAACRDNSHALLPNEPFIARQPPAFGADPLRILHPGGKPDVQRSAHAGRAAEGGRRFLL